MKIYKKVMRATVLFAVLFAHQLNAEINSFQEFKNNIYQDSFGVYIVEGDLPISTEEGLLDYYNNVVIKSANGELIIDRENNLDNRWDDATKMNLTYCVSTLFNDNYDAVVAAMETATSEWEESANVNFIHQINEDEDCTNTNNNIVFDVNPTPAEDQDGYIARAFFPSENRQVRNILISNSGLNPTVTDLTLTGVLRHELGHVLGFRHEHTRPEAEADTSCIEDNNWRVVTDYDSNSVMHYPQCNGTGGWALNLTDIDRAGAGQIYPFNLIIPGFNAQFYLNQYADLRAAFGDNHQAALDHWFNNGIDEGRRGSIEFNVHFYLNHYPDIRAAFGNNYQAVLNHWLDNGINEGRRGSIEFDVQFYLNQYADLRAAFGDNYQSALNHWVSNGIREGRIGI